jgi:hypothetical protein
MVTVGEFSSQKALTAYIRELLQTIGCCNSVKTTHPAAYNFFVELFERHPKYPAKLHGMVDISIGRNAITPQYYELNIITSTCETVDISWKQCVTGKSTNSLRAAMRTAVTSQIFTFKNAAVMRCELCECTDNDMEYHVDHVRHFEDLACEFMMGRTDIPTEFANTALNTKCFKEEDSSFEEAWQTHHASHAVLRILCRPCNLKRPRWLRLST